MTPKRQFTKDEARRIGDTIGANWGEVPLEQFRQGLAVELEHGSHDPQTNVTNDDEILTGKIALAHLKEYPDYYDRLEALEKNAEEYWSAKTRKP
jgi:hypothetical protein